MSGGDWHAFDREVRGRVRELALELLGKPSFRLADEWLWGRKGMMGLRSGECCTSVINSGPSPQWSLYAVTLTKPWALALQSMTHSVTVE